MKRRTKQDKEKNDNILQQLFIEYKISNTVADNIPRSELIESGYIGSLPYTFPTATKNFMIRQNPKPKHQREPTYTIFRMFNV